MGSLTVTAGPVAVALIDDDRICNHVRAKGAFEPDTLAAWAEMCKPGTEVLDVGAYSGLFAIAAAKLWARPIAVEPVPTMVKRIRANAEANGATVTVIQAAASDRDGKAHLGLNEAVHLTAGASLLRKSGGMQVKTIRLDSLRVSNVSAIKIDVERHELAVLNGAIDMIRRERPRLIIEALDASARAAVKRMLLRLYRQTAFLDGRNMILEPL